MQNFHYNYVKNKDNDKTEMLMTNTDSLICKIEAENVYEDLRKDEKLLDFVNYQKDSKYYNDANNLVVDKMKDKASGVP